VNFSNLQVGVDGSIQDRCSQQKLLQFKLGVWKFKIDSSACLGHTRKECSFPTLIVTLSTFPPPLIFPHYYSRQTLPAEILSSQYSKSYNSSEEHVGRYTRLLKVEEPGLGVEGLFQFVLGSVAWTRLCLRLGGNVLPITPEVHGFRINKLSKWKSHPCGQERHIKADWHDSG
jgi:hypothetical protein